MATEQGFSNQKKKGTAQFKTIHSAGSDSFGTVSISKSVYDISSIDESIVSVSDIIGSDGQVKFWKIQIVAHGASVGNVLRITSGAIKNFEFEVVEVVDADNIHVFPIAPSKPAALDTAKVMGWVTNKTSDTGATLASMTLPPDGEVIPTNSTTTPLGAGGVFTGPAFEILKYSVINVTVFSNVASATNGVTVQFSSDAVNWDHSHSTTYTAATGVGYIFNAEYRYARVVYTNGATPQASFRLQTIGKVNFVKQSLYTIAQSVNGNMFAELGKNVIIGETTGGGGGYVAVKVNPSGALTTEATVTGTVEVSNFPATQAVSGPLTNAELRASAVPISGTVNTGLTQPLTNAELRASAVPVSVNNFPATQPVSGSVSVSSLPSIPAGTNAIGTVSVSNFPATQTVQQTPFSASFQEILNLTTTAQTFTAPANSRWCKIYADDTNTVNIRVKIGGTATTSSGLQLQPGRAEDFSAVGDISVIAESGSNQKVNVHFGV